MTNKDTEQKIRQAFSNAVPDIRDSILSDCKTKKGAVIIMTDTNKKTLWARRLAGIAAAFLLLIGGLAGFQIYRANYSVASTISLDVNPSIEIQVNKKEQVLSVTPRNEDAKIVVGDMDFKGSSLDVTVNALIGSMLRNGYLNELANSILISVDSQDPAKSAELKERLASEINDVLQTGTFNGAVLSQTISADSNLRDLADTYGIALGKAQLIQQIIAQNAFYSFEDLVPLSINELNLLTESGNLNLSNVSSLGTASDKAYIGEEKAMKLALSHAGVPAESLSEYELELDYEHGTMVYEVEFDCEGFEYNYEIDAVTGAILKNQKEATGANTNSSQPHHNPSHTNIVPEHVSYIGENQAREVALSHAGLSADAVTAYQHHMDHEHNTMIYEIEFHCQGFEYDYEIDAYTGAILKHEKDQDDDYIPPQTDSSQQPSDGSGSYIGEAQAKEIALSHAGVSVEAIYNYEFDLDDDDGIVIYELEFETESCEYEYEIHAVDGSILKYEWDEKD